MYLPTLRELDPPVDDHGAYVRWSDQLAQLSPVGTDARQLRAVEAQPKASRAYRCGGSVPTPPQKGANPEGSSEPPTWLLASRRVPKLTAGSRKRKSRLRGGGAGRLEDPPQATRQAFDDPDTSAPNTTD